MTAVTMNYKFNLIDFDKATWHDAEYANWHIVDAVLSTFFGTAGFTGVWANSTTYTVGQIAVDTVEGKTYECLVAHVSESSGTFAADRATNPTYWALWILAHAGDTDNPHATPTASIIINGNFDIWQRGTTFAGITDEYTADRFKYEEVGAGVVTVKRAAIVPDGQSDFCLQVDVTTADAAIAAGDFYHILYAVEGYDAMMFGAGTVDVQRAMLSFWVRSAVTGTYCISFRNAAKDRSFIMEYTINVAGVYEYKSLGPFLDAGLGATWVTDNGVGMWIGFALAVGATFQTPVNVWTAGDYYASDNQVNLLEDTANNFYLSRVKLEVGLAATPFVRRSYAQELAACQRYYTKTFKQGVIPAQNAGRVGAISVVAVGTAAAQAVQGVWQYPVTMRDDPTIVTYNPSAANANWRNIDTPGDVAVAVEATESNDRCAVIGTGATVADGDRHRIHATADAELN